MRAHLDAHAALDALLFIHLDTPGFIKRINIHRADRNTGPAIYTFFLIPVNWPIQNGNYRSPGFKGVFYPIEP